MRVAIVRFRVPRRSSFPALCLTSRRAMAPGRRDPPHPMYVWKQRDSVLELSTRGSTFRVCKLTGDLTFDGRHVDRRGSGYPSCCRPIRLVPPLPCQPRHTSDCGGYSVYTREPSPKAWPEPDHDEWSEPKVTINSLASSATPSLSPVNGSSSCLTPPSS